MFWNKRKIERNDVRYNFKHGHLGHVKKVIGQYPNQEVTSVFMSSKDTDENIKNIKMDKPIKVGKKEHSYFIKRVRTYPANTYSNKTYKKRLSKKDRKTSNHIYKRYLRNKKRD